MQKAKLDFNNFSTGVVSDTSEVNTPQGVLLECVNYELQANGGLRLRPALQKEDNAVQLLTSGTASVVSGYVWEAPAGEEGTQIVLLQADSSFRVLLRSSDQGSSVVDVTPSNATSPHGIFSAVTDIAPIEYSGTYARLSYSSTSKYCVITGLAGTIGGTTYQELVYILEYHKGGSVTAYADVVWVRDFFGLPDGRVGGSRTIETPPTAAVAYNLFNQGWAAEVSGTYPNRYVINAFYNTAGVASTESVAVQQTMGLGGTLAINGSYAVSGVYTAPYGANKVTVFANVYAASGFQMSVGFQITGTDANGNSVSEYVYAPWAGVGVWSSATSTNYYSTITSVVTGSIESHYAKIGEGNLYPGDYDNWTLGVYASSATTRAFTPNLVVQGPDDAGKAPLGNFVIPLHYRSSGLSTQTMGRGLFVGAYNKIFQVNTDALPNDRSGRPTKVASYAGRFWYASTRDKCSNEEVQSTSPSVGNMIAFSRVVQTIEDCCKCYQRNNPTSPDFNAVLADDGGHVVIQELGEVRELLPQANGLMVIASNGVWFIAGNNDSGFSATGYSVTKLSDTGCVAEAGVCYAGDVVLYPSMAGIEVIGRGESGGLQIRSVTDGKISSDYRNIEDISSFVTAFDHSRQCARFLYKVSGVYSKELVLNTQLGAWAGTSYNVSGTQQIVGVVQFSGTRNATFGGVRVPHVGYVIKDGTGIFIGYLRYDDADGGVYAWEDLDGGEYASLSTAFVGHISLGDLTLNKHALYFDLYCERTEDSYTVTNGDVQMNHESSCLVDAYWEWADTSGSQYKSQQFEGYRYRRIPLLESSNGTYTFSYGQSVIVTHNKLRGHGRTIGIRLQPSAAKDSRPLGWSIDIGAN